ncbi:MAG: monofunctional biosynthetic peptidoglycan transglycosylase [Gammaproteobacteria bacterium]|nr:monofunctional biosynthetic peptidoglycan transglycosylase [Gammaproteobacteria bacterium]
MFWNIRYKLQNYKARGKRLAKYSRWAIRLLVLGLLIDLGYIWGSMPDWHHYERGPVQKSMFIKTYEYQRATDKKLPSLRWRPVALSSISQNIIRAAIVAEDSRFYQHEGIDTQALKEAMEYNIENYKIGYGGSTISQQMIKNMLLTPSRNPIRKWHELWLTLSLERNVSKGRILEIYLNVAEFGQGLYGVDAAARHYWGKSAAKLSMNEAIELVASLTSPVKHNPAARTKYFLKQKKKISRNMGL